MVAGIRAALDLFLASLDCDMTSDSKVGPQLHQFGLTSV